MGSPLAFVAAVVGSGVFVGLAIISATVLGVDALRAGARSAHLDASFYLLAGGTLAGVLAAGLVTWWLLAPLGSAYRRGALSIVCSFATILLMLVCIPIHQLWGRAGLLGAIALAAASGTLLARRARRLAQST